MWGFGNSSISSNLSFLDVFLGGLIGFTSYFYETNYMAKICFKTLIFPYIWEMPMVETKHFFSGIAGSA